MKIENKDFWENEKVIATQGLKKTLDFENYMLDKASKGHSEFGPIKSIKIFGCGTGREIESIAEIFNPTRIVASDIASNMIAKCNENLKLWKINHITETLVGDAKEYDAIHSEFDLVTIFNSMMTYIPERASRLKIFRNSLQILKPHGFIVGTVHNQVGTPLKTAYFSIRNLFSFILKDKVGNRNTGHNGFKVQGYYYTKKGLLTDLVESGFKNVEVYSLEDYYHSQGHTYNRKKSYNNLIFIAQK
jgi:SAM-dependent methyltransferase